MHPANLVELCSICLDSVYEPPQTVLVLPCRHVFHDDCMTRLRGPKMTCPLCFRSVTQRPAVPLVLPRRQARPVEPPIPRWTSHPDYVRSNDCLTTIKARDDNDMLVLHATPGFESSDRARFRVSFDSSAEPRNFVAALISLDQAARASCLGRPWTVVDFPFFCLCCGKVDMIFEVDMPARRCVITSTVDNQTIVLDNLREKMWLACAIKEPGVGCRIFWCAD